MDGVLVDSRAAIYQAFEDVLAANGVTGVTRQDMDAVNGKPIHAMYAILAPEHDSHALQEAHVQHHEKNPHLFKAYDRVAEVLDTLHKQGLKIGLFTGFDKRTYDRLAQFELTDYFDSVMECTRYTKHKPDPEGLLLCLDELGATPETAVYIGDAVSDVLAGKAAGMRATVGVTQGFGARDALEGAGADYIIDSLGELPALLTKLETAA